jgi:glycosyltransferase involved in cell wall biosynthesis
MKLSIIIPVYNEEKTVAKILKRVVNVKLPVAHKEILVINDGSTDKTRSIIESLKLKEINLYNSKKNQGKGSAVKFGIKKATGDYIVIQDADLEYDPKDIINLLKHLQSVSAEVVYGSRLKRLPNFSRDERTMQFFIHYLGNKFLSLTASILYLHWVTDMESCYKLFPRKAMESITIHAKGFEFEPEITAKLLKNGYKISEIPISTNPRGYGEGKKLDTVKDGIKAIWALVKYRFID